MAQKIYFIDRDGQQTEIVYYPAQGFTGELGGGASASAGVSVGTASASAGINWNKVPKPTASGSAGINYNQAREDIANGYLTPTTKTINLIGAGTLKTYFEPSGLEMMVAQDLIQRKWDINDVKLTNAINVKDPSQWLKILAPVTLLAPTWNYFIQISVNALVNDNPERIRQGIGNYLQNHFSDLSLKVIDPSAVADSPGLFSGLKLPGISSGDFMGNLGTSLGVSTPVVAAGLLVLAVIVLKR